MRLLLVSIMGERLLQWIRFRLNYPIESFAALFSSVSLCFAKKINTDLLFSSQRYLATISSTLGVKEVNQTVTVAIWLMRKGYLIIHMKRSGHSEIGNDRKLSNDGNFQIFKFGN